MKRVFLLALLILPLVFSSCSDDDDNKKEPVPPFSYETIVGNTYIRRAIFEYHLYTFKEDGTIDVEVRERTIDGKLLSKSIGYYEYDHPILKLKINSGCENCFNEFEAKVYDERRQFSFTLWTDEYRSFFVYDYYSWDDYK